MAYEELNASEKTLFSLPLPIMYSDRQEKATVMKSCFLDAKTRRIKFTAAVIYLCFVLLDIDKEQLEVINNLDHFLKFKWSYIVISMRSDWFSEAMFYGGIKYFIECPSTAFLKAAPSLYNNYGRKKCLTYKCESKPPFCATCEIADEKLNAKQRRG